MNIYHFFAPLPFLHPLFFITAACMLGICWQAGTCSIYLACFLCTHILGLAYLNSSSFKNLCTVIICITLSFLVGKYIYLDQHAQFHAWARTLQKPVDVIANVVDVTISPTTKNYPIIIKVRLEKIHTIDYLDGTLWQKTPHYLLIYTKKIPPLLVQDKIFLSEIKICLSKRESWQQYAMRNNIGGTIFCNKLRFNHISRPSWSLKRMLWTIRQSLFERLNKKMSPILASFYSLLFMGIHYDDKNNNELLKNLFQTWGILHYLARSGLHLVVFVMIWNFLLLLIPCSHRMRNFLLIILSSIYFLLSWPSLSFIRAFATYLLYKTTEFSNRTANTIHILTLITLLFLLCNPTHLFCLDFQLSFGLTFALAWMHSNNFIFKSSYTNS